MPTMVLRQILKDRRTLADIMDGGRPGLDRIRRRALVGEWERNSRLPDHVLRNRGEAGLGEVDSDWGLVRATLRAYVAEYLYRREQGIHVHFDKFGEWQRELADLSPLPFLAFALWQWNGAPDPAHLDEVQQYTGKYLDRLRHTMLITPHLPLVEDVIDVQGLHDRHIHLNGSTEIDKVWQDQLANVDEAIREIRQALPHPQRIGRQDTNRSMLAELYEQLSLTPAKVGHYLRVARRVRMVLCDYALGLGIKPHYSPKVLMVPGTLPELDLERRTSGHPLADHIPRDAGKLVPELLLLILVFRQLEKDAGKSIAGHLLHLYLLILNCVAVPLTIQGERQKGFDQFQKFTFTEMRSQSESGAYVDRFRQLNHAPKQDLAVLEGRFAPPDSPRKLAGLLLNILKDLNEYRGGKRPRPQSLTAAAEFSPQSQPGEPRMELYLVAHFIKEADQGPSRSVQDGCGTILPPCRHHKLRQKLMRRWRVLRHVREAFQVARRFIVGIDAAANEQHARPEVFAPLYRAARRSGMVNFTYHAGEDFEHLVGGIRAIAEAVRFLGLERGGRIGHGTAIGIDPDLWLRQMPQTIRMRRGEYLDDLVFAHGRLLGEQGFEHLLPQLERLIHDLSFKIYGQGHSPAMLWAAWKMRALDPLAIAPEAEGAVVVDHDLEREVRRLRKARQDHPGAFALFLRHHSAAGRRASVVQEAVATDWLPSKALRALQNGLLKDLASGQVTLETLPTSNVRISFYEDHAEHHVLRWLAEAPDSAPTVCVGSDDPGIFANSMRGEYYHLARELKRAGKTWDEVGQALRRLNHNSRIYGFRS